MPCTFPKINQSLQRWSLPPPNWYKVNVDGAVFKEQGSIGVGVVIRNAQGEVMGVMSKEISRPLGAIKARAKAMEVGILFAWDLGLKNIVAEGDSLAVVQALKGSIIPTISIQKVTEGISWWLKKFDNWKILHARRSSNIAAHSMAKEAKSILESVIWVEDSPLFITDQLMYDVLTMDIFPSL